MITTYLYCAATVAKKATAVYIVTTKITVNQIFFILISKCVLITIEFFRGILLLSFYWPVLILDSQ